MFDKVVVKDVIDKFNIDRNATAKLSKFTKAEITVKSSGLHDEKIFQELKSRFSDAMKIEVEIKEIAKSGKEGGKRQPSTVITYASKGISPSEEILRVLDRYYEGTTRKHECCDD
ncbi:MAG: hypothetical protein HY513_03380 [Candidatus Aenigmarchaeota archaeon]|nr:hypothetical protein [Candidatus Aenigmarchaeota archaeon]